MSCSGALDPDLRPRSLLCAPLLVLEVACSLLLASKADRSSAVQGACCHCFGTTTSAAVLLKGCSWAPACCSPSGPAEMTAWCLQSAMRVLRAAQKVSVQRYDQVSAMSLPTCGSPCRYQADTGRAQIHLLQWGLPLLRTHGGVQLSRVLPLHGGGPCLPATAALSA